MKQALIYPHIIAALLFVSLSFDVRSQSNLPDYTVSVNWNSGPQIVDLIGLLNSSGIFPDMSNECNAYIQLEGNECFIQGLSINDNGIDAWDLILTPQANQDLCCGYHELTYSIVCYIDGVMELQSGHIFLTIVCGARDCARLDFSDPEYSNSDECINVCENSTMDAFAPSYAGGGYTYSWVIQNGSVVAGAGTNEATIAWGNYGSGNVEVTISQGPLFTPIVFEICVNILEGPQALFTSTGSACLDAPILFTNASSLNATGFSWDFGDGTTSQLENPSNIYTSPGTYDVTLTVTSPVFDNEGNVICTCSDSYTEEVTVDNLVGPEIFWISTLCEGDTSSYWTDADCGNYFWDVLDSNGTPITFTGQGTDEIFVSWGLGPYGTISLSVNNCTPAHCDTPTIVQVPIIPADGIINGSSIVCAGSIMSYNMTKWNSVEYDWTVTGGYIIQDEAPTLTVQWGAVGQGSIDVEYSSEFLQCLPEHSTDDCKGFAHLDVLILPEYQLYSNAIANTACVGTTTTFTASGTSGTNFIWSITPNIPYTNTSSGVIEVVWPAGSTSYTVTTSPGNIGDYCNNIESVYISVEDIPMPTSITGSTEVCSQYPSYIYEGVASSGLTIFWTPTAANPGGGLPTLTPFDGLYTSVTWGMGGPFTLEAQYLMTSAPYCMSDPFSLAVDEITIDPSTSIIASGSPCANNISSYSISTLHPDAEITWKIVPAYLGSVSAGQGTQGVDIQWNDFSGTSASATLVASISLCSVDVDFLMNVNINKSPEPSLSAVDFCQGTSGTITVNNASQFGSFSWSPSGGTGSSINPVSAGTYTVSTIDLNGCTSTAGTTISLLPTPSLNLSTSAGTTLTNGSPASTTIVAPFDPSYSYSWVCNGVPQTNNSATLTHNWSGVNLPQGYSYQVEVDFGICSATAGITITESPGGSNPCPNPPCCEPEPYTFSANATQNTPSCEVWGFSLSSSSNTSFTSWSSGNGQSSSSATPTFSYSEIGYYTAFVSGQVASSNNMGTCTVVSSVQVNVPIIAHFSPEISCDGAGNTPEVCLDDETTTMPGVVITSANYNLNGPVGYADPLCVGVFGNSNPNTQLTVTTSAGCVSTYSESIVVPGNISMSIPTQLCVGESGNFSATCPGAVSFDWNFRDETLGIPNVNALFNGANATHSYTQLGSGTGPYVLPITVTATLANGCEFEAFAPLIIHDTPEMAYVVSVDSDFKFCIGGGTEELELFPTATAGTTISWWQSNPSNVIATGSVLSVNAAGSYGASITDNGTGCTVDLAPVDVKSWPPVPSGIAGPEVVCDGNCVDLSAPAGNLSHVWSNTSGIIGYVNTISICANMISGSEVFTLVSTDNTSQCTATSTHLLTSEATPVVTPGSWPLLPCEGAPVTLLVDPVEPNVTYTWSGGNANPYTTTTAGMYSVTGTHDVTGCSSTVTYEIYPCPNLCSVPAGCYTACDSGKVICGPDGLDTYQWNFNYTPISGGTSPCFTATQDGVYTLTATNEFECFKTSDILDLEFIDCDSCSFQASDIEGLGLLSNGVTILPSGEGCCMYSINPIVNINSNTLISNLCMDINWGDGSQDLAIPLGTVVDHCYTGECTEYNVSVKIFCCSDPSGLTVGLSDVAVCGCIPNCYVRNSFHENFTQVQGADNCEVHFTSTQFLGPDMISHQNPSYYISGVSDNGTTVNTTIAGQYDFSYTIPAGTYDVCYTLDGTSNLGTICEFTHCHEIIVNCCTETNVISPCGLEESDLAGMDLVSLGSNIDDNGYSCCSYGLSPMLAQWANVDPSQLCVDIIWGDGDILHNVNFGAGYTHCFTPGEYMITLVVSCCEDEGVEYVFTEFIECAGTCEIPDIDFSWLTAMANINCPDGCALIFDPIPMPQGICLTWDFGDGAQYSGYGNDSPYHCYSASGLYPVCVTATCCDDPSYEVTICHGVNVSCNQNVSFCAGDFDSDGFVGVNDLLEVLGAYGEFCAE
jgi:PKD repeat protein